MIILALIFLNHDIDDSIKDCKHQKSVSRNVSRNM